MGKKEKTEVRTKAGKGAKKKSYTNMAILV